MVLRTNEGGGHDHVARLSGELAARGHEVAVAGPRESMDGAEVFNIAIQRPISLSADSRTVRRLARIYRDYDPDVVNAHGSKEGVTARLARLLRPRTPLVYTPHGYSFDSHFGSGLNRAAYRAAETAVAPLASRVLCVSEAERRLASRIGPKSRTRVVYNGIDALTPSDPAPALAPALGDGPLIVSLAGPREGKGVETLIDAVPAVLEEFPAARFALAGDGPLRTELEARARLAGVGERFHFLGQIADVASVLSPATIFVHPSWGESFPYAVLEAMSLGLPIVATDVGGVAEAIPDGECALLAPARQAGALSDALRALLRDPELALTLGTAARRRHGERFTLAKMVDGTLAVYEEIARRR